MELHEINLNASEVANNLGKIYRGPLLLPSEVRLQRPKGRFSLAAYTCLKIDQDHPFVKMNGDTIPSFLLAHFAKQLGMLIIEHSRQQISFNNDPAMPLVKITQGCAEQPGVLNLEVVPVLLSPTRCEFFSVVWREKSGITSCWEFALTF